MERREVLLKCLGGTALMLVPSRLLPSPATNVMGKVYELWYEACLYHYWGQGKRAHDLCMQALALAPENLDTKFRADLIELLVELRRLLDYAEWELGKQRESLKRCSHCPDVHFEMAHTLTCLGREEEAKAEFRLAMENPQQLCAEYTWDPSNRIGRQYYRQGEYHMALKWFERTLEATDLVEPVVGDGAREAIEKKIQTFVALGTVREARSLTCDYARRLGRLPWPERWVLAKVGIDADAIYLEQNPLKG